MTEMIDEIRINSHYTQHVTSETKSAKEKGTPKIRHHVTRTDGYLRKMSSGFGQQGILPPNCRYIEPLQNGNLVVIEEPPAYRTITVDYPMRYEIAELKKEGKLEQYGIDAEFYKDNHNSPFKFTLAFPYTIFILMFDKYSSLMMGQVYLRNARLAGYSDYLLKMPMMNISSEQSICFGDKASKHHQSLNAAIEHTIMVFWSAQFNGDYTYNYTAYKAIPGINSYIEWQALSQIDPMFIYNVDWIKMKPTLHSTITTLKDQYNNNARGNLQYRELSRLFTRAADTGKTEKPTPKARKKKSLFYDIAQGIYLTSTFYIHVGDPIAWGKKTAFINSFIGFHDSDKIRYVQIELEDKRLINVRLTKKAKTFIYESIKKLRYEEQGTLKNGTVIKEDDIVVIKNHLNNEVYKRVYFIRKTRDGITEARLGNSFYILENTEGVVLDMEKPTYYGLELNKEDEYIIFTTMNSGGIMNPGQHVKFNGITVNEGNNNLLLDFKTAGKGRVDHPIIVDAQATTQKPLYKIDNTKIMPPIFRCGRRLLTYKFDSKCVSGYAWGTPEGIAFNNNYSTSAPTVKDITEHLLINDGTTLHIESFDLDITFNVGDKVVYADWENPINMLIPRTIEAFKTDSRTQQLEFVLSDKDGKLTQVKYITGTGSSGTSAPYIHIGKIRKISNTFGRVSAGTKIIAEKGYIPHFPKKDVNIIIGFITDTGGDDPLVLCSNCCTLWFSEMMENFKRVTLKSKRWVDLPHAPIDITKIKLQSGDLLFGASDFTSNAGWMVSKVNRYKNPRILSLEAFASHPSDYKLDNYVKNHTIFDCIPNPRIGQSEQAKLDPVNAWPNFHGLFMESKVSPYIFLKDERSVINVQSSC